MIPHSATPLGQPGKYGIQSVVRWNSSYITDPYQSHLMEISINISHYSNKNISEEIRSHVELYIRAIPGIATLSAYPNSPVKIYRPFNMPSLSSNIALGLIAAGVVPLVAAGPCDIYASGGTPCVAAHSTTRALYSSYTGALYQVKRGSDSTTTNIAPLSAGGVANAATQDSFCSGTTCLITIIYDQSGRGNHLTQAPPGGFQGPEANGYDNLASATGAPVTLNGQKAYGVFVSPGTGYRNNNANGIATGDAAEGMYSVLDGTHYNSGCCFDYGNAETSSKDTGNGHMEAIYCMFSPCSSLL